jgi:hypothetical protein
MEAADLCVALREDGGEAAAGRAPAGRSGAQPRLNRG